MKLNLFQIIKNDSLYLNSIYLMVSTIALAFSGFLYWWISARLISSYEVGIASTLTSVLIYIGLISQLGLNISLIAYLPQSIRQERKISTVLSIVTSSALLFSFLFLIFSNLISKSLNFLTQNFLISISFILFMIFGSLNVTIESIFISERKSQKVLIKNVVLSVLKIMLLILLIKLGGYGIFSAWTISIVISVLIGYLLIPISIRKEISFRIDKKEFQEMARHSWSNYFAAIFSNLAMNAIPVVITSINGPKTTAYFSVAMSFASLIYSIPISICNALFAEGAYKDTSLYLVMLKSIKLISIILIPSVLFILVFGKKALMIFGVEYSYNSADLLSLLAVSSLFIAINVLSWTFLNIKKRVREIIITSFISAILILVLSIIWSPFGLIGIGYSWLVGQMVTSLIYIGFIGWTFRIDYKNFQIKGDK